METAKWAKIGKRELQEGGKRKWVEKNGEKLGGKENGKWPGGRGERKEEGEQ